MKKPFLFLLFLIFVFNLVSASTLSISPTQIDFVGKINEEICNKITLKSDSLGNLIGEDRWAKESEIKRKFLLHNLSSEKLGLKLNYNRLLVSTSFTQQEICIKGKFPGVYHGLLLYKIGGSPTGVGIWMNVSLIKRNSLARITGNVLGIVKEKSNFNLLLFGSLILAFIFCFLVLKLKLNFKKRTEFFD